MARSGKPRTVVELDFVSDLAAKAPRVWSAVTTMSGVNAELRPLIHMTSPPDLDRVGFGDPRVRQGFDSWILLFGVIPIDRHRFGFDEVVEGRRFEECSRSWLSRGWHHTRTVTSTNGSRTSRVRDELRIEPRIRVLAPVMRAFVGAVFRHRHTQLRRRFGEVG